MRGSIVMSYRCFPYPLTPALSLGERVYVDTLLDHLRALRR